MKLTITGRGMQVHDSVREYAEQKAQKLERFSDQLQKVEIILSTQGLVQVHRWRMAEGGSPSGSKWRASPRLYGKPVAAALQFVHRP